MAGNSSFDEILSTTLKNYIPKLTDNIFQRKAFVLCVDEWSDNSAYFGWSGYRGPDHLWDKLNCWLV